MKRTVCIIACTLVVSTFLSTLATADEPTLSWHDQGGVLYVSGGVGEVELDWIKNSGREFGLRLLLAERNGAYVAGVHVQISDRQGKTMLDIADAGPYLLAKLPTGTYRIDATYEGRRQSRQIHLRDGQPVNMSVLW